MVPSILPAQVAASPLALGAGLAALALVLALAWGLRRVQAERNRYRRLLVENYDKCVRGLHGVVTDRQRLCEQVAQTLAEVPPSVRAQAEMVSKRFTAGLHAMSEALAGQLKAEERLRFNFDAFHAELRAADETLARVSELVKNSVTTEVHGALKQEYAEYRVEAETTKDKMRTQVHQLQEEKTNLEQKITTMSDPEELAEVKQLLTEMETDIADLEVILGVDESGPRELSDEEVQKIEHQVAEINQVLQVVESEINETVAESQPRRRGRDQQMRLKKIKRGVLEQTAQQQRVMKDARELAETKQQLESVARGNQEILQEFQRMEASSKQFKQAVGESRQELQQMTARITDLEGMEETSHRVRNELRNLGIINLSLQRQVEELEHSQVLYERALRNLSKLQAEVGERDQRISQMAKTIHRNESEIKRLQDRIRELTAAQSERRITVDPKALESEDVDQLRATLRATIEETEGLRGRVGTLERELTEKQHMVEKLERELDQLSIEYQKLFDKMPLGQ